MDRRSTTAFRVTQRALDLVETSRSASLRPSATLSPVPGRWRVGAVVLLCVGSACVNEAKPQRDAARPTTSTAAPAASVANRDSPVPPYTLDAPTDYVCSDGETAERPRPGTTGSQTWQYARSHVDEPDPRRLTLRVSVGTQRLEDVVPPTPVPKRAVELREGKRGFTWLVEPDRPKHSRRALVWQESSSVTIELYWFVASEAELLRVAETVERTTFDRPCDA